MNIYISFEKLFNKSTDFGQKYGLIIENKNNEIFH